MEIDDPTLQRLRQLLAPDFTRSVNIAAASAAKLYEPVPHVAAWRSLPFAASISDLGGGYAASGYTKDAFGFVHLRGVVKFTGVPVNGQGIALLPVGYRPPTGVQQFAVMASYSGGVVALALEVNTGGALNLYNASGVGWTGTSCSLDQISFDSGVLP